MAQTRGVTASLLVVRVDDTVCAAPHSNGLEEARRKTLCFYSYLGKKAVTRQLSRSDLDFRDTFNPGVGHGLITPKIITV